MGRYGRGKYFAVDLSIIPACNFISNFEVVTFLLFLDGTLCSELWVSISVCMEQRGIGRELGFHPMNIITDERNHAKDTIRLLYRGGVHYHYDSLIDLSEHRSETKLMIPARMDCRSNAHLSRHVIVVFFFSFPG